MTFDVIPLRFHCVARRAAVLSGNHLRGRFGKALRDLDPVAYHRLFEPRRSEGPSGLKDAPRPFVFRVRQSSVQAGAKFEFGFHLFDPREPVELITRAFAIPFELDRVEGVHVLSLPLEAATKLAKVRVRFLTPTELKWDVPTRSARPEFPILFARIRDRISTLRTLYQGGPLEVDFKSMADRAAQIKMTRCEIQHVDAERTSRSTGQTHSLGGFTGVAEYEGNLGEFLPYLEIARWTG